MAKQELSAAAITPEELYKCDELRRLGHVDGVTTEDATIGERELADSKGLNLQSPPLRSPTDLVKKLLEFEGGTILNRSEEG